MTGGGAAAQPPWPAGAAWIDGCYCPIEEPKISVLDLGVLSVAAVLLDTIADAAAAAGVAAAGAIILAVRGWYWLDPAVALAIAVMVSYHAVKLIRKILSRPSPPVADNAE